MDAAHYRRLHEDEAAGQLERTTREWTAHRARVVSFEELQQLQAPGLGSWELGSWGELWWSRQSNSLGHCAANSRAERWWSEGAPVGSFARWDERDR